MKTILWKIFFDVNNNWAQFVTKYGKRVRAVVLKEIEKFRTCGEPKQGFKTFACEGCGEIKIVAYRCKSR
jgi:hypothetical protein